MNKNAINRSTARNSSKQAAKNSEPVKNGAARFPNWLKTAIIYQVYPQSFCDSNADGIGDIPGVISKLDYIQSLGCDVIWLTPCFDSPFGDGGYDIRDFYKVAPRYGTNADLCRLFQEAHKRGMRVILDLVAGHTSSEHAWFRESARDARNRFAHRYIWTDNVWKAPGQGLEGIRGFSERDGQFVTNFFYFQPALNYGFANPDPALPWQLPVTHPDVQATRRELFEIMSHWIQLGADGFRVDMAFSLVKNDPGAKETIALWQEIRKQWDEKHPDAALIAEWSVPEQALNAGFHVDFMIHFGTPAYTTLFRAEANRDVFRTTRKSGNSFFDQAGRGDITEFLKIYLEQRRKTRSLGLLSLPTGNHDISRLNSDRTEAELEVIFAFLLTQPGIPCIYYGDEIGMRHIENLPSREGGYGRTGARTPMQWSGGANAGFSRAPAKELYLPIDRDRSQLNVEKQANSKRSLLQTVKSLIQLRRSSSAFLPSADFKPLFAKKREYPFVYLRQEGNERFLVILNPSARSTSCLFEGKDLGTNFKRIIGKGVAISRKDQRILVKASNVSFGIFSCREASERTLGFESDEIIV